MPDSDSSTYSFRQRFMRHPILPESEVRVLIEDYQKTGNLKSAHRIVSHNYRLIFNTARAFAPLNDPVFWEYFHEGCVGALEAVSKFDLAGQDCKFISYAIWWIRQHMSRYRIYCAELIVVPGGERIKQKKAAIAELPADSFEAKMVKKHGTKAFKHNASVQPVSLEAPVSPGSNATVLDTLDDSTSNATRDLVFGTNDGVTVLEKLFAPLDYKERSIVSNYYGYNTSRVQTLSELGDMFGLSKERMRQLKNRALRKMKARAHTLGLSLGDVELV